MNDDHFLARADADPLMRKVASFRGNPKHPDVDATFAECIAQERYTRRRNRRLFGVFRWRYWLNRYYSWNVARLNRTVDRYGGEDEERALDNQAW